jgi:hypothetical protein
VKINPLSEKIQAAETALNAFSNEVGGDLSEDSLVDLLVDLMHWSEQQGVDFKRSLEVASKHFKQERGTK